MSIQWTFSRGQLCSLSSRLSKMPQLPLQENILKRRNLVEKQKDFSKNDQWWWDLNNMWIMEELLRKMFSVKQTLHQFHFIFFLNGYNRNWGKDRIQEGIAGSSTSPAVKSGKTAVSLSNWHFDLMPRFFTRLCIKYWPFIIACSFGNNWICPCWWL